MVIGGAVVAAIADDGVGASGAGADVAATVIGIAVAASEVGSAFLEGGTEERSSVQAPQPRATVPVNASNAAALRWARRRERDAFGPGSDTGPQKVAASRENQGRDGLAALCRA